MQHLSLCALLHLGSLMLLQVVSLPPSRLKVIPYINIPTIHPLFIYFFFNRHIG